MIRLHLAYALFRLDHFARDHVRLVLLRVELELGLLLLLAWHRVVVGPLDPHLVQIGARFAISAAVGPIQQERLLRLLALGFLLVGGFGRDKLDDGEGFGVVGRADVGLHDVVQVVCVVLGAVVGAMQELLEARNAAVALAVLVFSYMKL